MISIGALADLIRIFPRRAEYARTAEKFIGFILSNHVFRWNGKLGFCEDIHRTEHTPYVDNGHILCDPGHCLELTGLAGRCLLLMRENGMENAALKERCALLPELFARMFEIGFQPGPGGIVKAADAVTGELLNTDMPWWNLLETMRAAKALAILFPQSRSIHRPFRNFFRILIKYLASCFQNGVSESSAPDSAGKRLCVPFPPDSMKSRLESGKAAFHQDFPGSVCLSGKGRMPTFPGRQAGSVVRGMRRGRQRIQFTAAFRELWVYWVERGNRTHDARSPVALFFHLASLQE